MLKRMEGHKHSTDDDRVNELIKVCNDRPFPPIFN